MASATETFRERSRIDHNCENCRGRSRRLASQLDRMRDRSRVTGGAVANFRGRNAVQIRASVPSEVGPGQIVNASVIVSPAQFVSDDLSVLDPDYCTPPNLFGKGLNVDIEVRAGGQRLGSGRRCIPSIGGERELPFSFTAPTSTGRSSFNVIVRGHASGNRLGADSFSFQVAEGGGGGGAPTPADEDEDGGGPFDGPLLPCFLDPNRTCARPETLAWGSVGLLAAIVLLGR